MLRNEVEQSSAEEIYTEGELQKFRNEFKTLFNLMPDSVVIVDGKGKFLAVNDRVEEITGFKREELLGKNFLRAKIVTRKSKAILIKNLAKRMMGANIAPYEIEVVTKDGRKLPVEINATKIEYDGKPADLVIFRDLTKRREIEEALRESEEKFRNIFENANDAIIFLDSSGKILDVNRKAVEMFGGSRSEMLGKHFTEVKVFALRDLQRLVSVFAEGLAGKTPTLNIRIRNKKGREIPLECSNSLLKINGKFVGLLVIARDVTERKKMEDKLKQYSENLEELVHKRTEELLETEKRYSVVVEEASDGVTIIQDEKFAFVNKKCLEITGYSREELIGLPFEKIVDKKILRRAKEIYVGRMHGEKVPDAHEIALISKTSELIPVEVSGKLIQYQGRPADLAIVRDIRERKRMEEERLKLERLAAIGELATMVGHDLRNPLQAVTNAVYVLKNMYAKVDSAFEQYEEFLDLLPKPVINQVRQLITETFEKRSVMIQAIDESLNYANKIVSDLQDFARPTESRLIEADIESLIQESFSDISIPENVKVSVRYNPATPKLYVDPTQIRRVFMNLEANAIQAMPHGGELIIATSLKNDFATITFQDNGVGIPRKDREKLFTPLFTTKAKGLGMGLAICKKFIDAHGGSIEVKSEEGKGSTFTVKLLIHQKNGGENQWQKISPTSS